MPQPAFNIDEHLFYMLARDFFSRTRQGTFTRSQVVQRLEKIQDEVKRRRADVKTYTNTTFGTEIAITDDTTRTAQGD